MTDHPAIAAGCTPAEIEAFERLTINDIEGHPKAVLESLLHKGLISIAPDIITTGEGHTAKTYNVFVPVHHHHAFCSWAAEQTQEDPA